MARWAKAQLRKRQSRTMVRRNMERGLGKSFCYSFFMTRIHCRHPLSFALILALCTLAPLSGATAPSLNLPAGADEAAAHITPPILRAPIAFLSDDLLEGRGPATRGDELARLYIAQELAALGLQPGGPNGSWQQAFDVVGIHA